MSSDRFDTSLAFVLCWEGGFSDDPDDPGGRTNKGITQANYDEWRQTRNRPRGEVLEINDDEVRAIYRTSYWEASYSPDLNPQLDLVQFDTAVNMGVGRATRLLQRSLACGIDGEFGPVTRAAAAACDLAQAASDYCNLRETYYRDLVHRNPKLQKFLNGWLNRLNALRKHAGLPTLEGVEPEPAHTAKVPDLGINPEFDF
jgi:lysozyme family protein